MAVVYGNNVSGSLASGVGPADTTVVLDSAAGWPAIAAGDHAWVTLDNTINVEIVRATALSGTQLTVERAQDGTAAHSFGAGSVVEIRVTAALLRELAGGSAAGPTHANLWYGGSRTLLAAFDGATLASLANERDVPGEHSIDIDPPSGLQPAEAWTAYIVTADPSRLTEAVQRQLGFSFFSVFDDPSNTRDATLSGTLHHIWSIPNNQPSTTYPLRITLES